MLLPGVLRTTGESSRHWKETLITRTTPGSQVWGFWQLGQAGSEAHLLGGKGLFAGACLRLRGKNSEDMPLSSPHHLVAAGGPARLLSLLQQLPPLRSPGQILSIRSRKIPKPNKFAVSVANCKPQHLFDWATVRRTLPYGGALAWCQLEWCRHGLLSPLWHAQQPGDHSDPCCQHSIA